MNTTVPVSDGSIPFVSKLTHQLADGVPANVLHRDVKCSAFKLCVGDACDVRMMQE